MNGVPYVLFETLGQMRHRAGALHHVQRRAVCPPNVVDAAIAGEAGDDLDAHAAKVFADHPDLAGQVEVAEDVDADGADAVGWRGSDKLKERIAGRAITILLGALESFGVHRQNGNSLLLADALADRLHVVADDSDDAGGIDKRGFGLMRVDQLAQRRVKLLLASLDNVHSRRSVEKLSR